jgi:hypothetical protein
LRPYFSKLSSEGEVLWLTHTENMVTWDFASNGNDGRITVDASAVDPQGHVYFTGTFNEPMTFGETELSDGGIFLVKIDGRTGRFLWARSFGSTSLTPTMNTRPMALVVSEGGDVYLAGSFLIGRFNTVHFGSITIPPRDRQRADSEGFVAKVSPEGEVIWVSVSGGDYASEDDRHSTVFSALAAAPSGTIYVGGSYGLHKGAALGDHVLPIVPESLNSWGAFVSALSTEGDWLWARGLELPEHGSVRGLGIDKAENIYVAGGARRNPNDTATSEIYLAKLASGRSAVVSPQLTDEGGFAFGVLGEAGLANRVEASSDLRNWIPWTNFISERSLTPLTAPLPEETPQLFFRVKP